MSILIQEIREAAALNAENTSFYVEINHPEFGWIPYTLNPDDTDQTVSNEDLLALIGSNYSAYVAPTQDELDEEAARGVRYQRDYLLTTEVDPIAGNALRWNDLADAQRLAWTQYRTDLLNIPQQAGFPGNVTWPTTP